MSRLLTSDDACGSLFAASPGSLLDRFACHVKAAPERACTASAESILSFADVDERCRSLASQIRAKLPVNRPTLAIYAGRHSQLTIALLAAIRAGVAFSILDTKYPAERITACLRYQCPGLIVNAASGRGESEKLNQLCEELKVKQIAAVSAEQSEALTFASQALPLETGRSLAKPMYLAFTSGTTGVPKAVWGTEAPVVNCLEWESREFRIRPDDRISVLSGLAHDPLLRDTLLPIWAGASSWYPSQDVFTIPGALFEWLRDMRISIVHLTASLCHLLLKTPKSSRLRILPDLKVALFGGEPLTQAMAHRFSDIAPRAEIVNCYGATETPQIMGFYRWSKRPTETGVIAPDSTHVPIGHGIDGVQLLILDDRKRLCGVDVVGQIFIRTPHRALCVEDLERVTSEAYIINPYTNRQDDLLYKTGDYGKYRDDGEVVFVGRRDRQVKVRGFRVDLSEVERAIANCTEVEHFFVDTWEEGACTVITAFVTSDTEAMLDPALVKEQLALKLPDFMVPQRIVRVPSIPLTPNGKVDARQLRAICFDTQSAGRVADPRSQNQTVAPHDVDSRLEGLALPLDHDGGLRFADSLAIVETSCVLQDEFGIVPTVAELQRCRTRDDLCILVRLKLGDSKLMHAPASEPRCAAAESLPRNEIRMRERSRLLAWLPQRERIWDAFANRAMQLLARVAPDGMRVRLHRQRGVVIGHGTSIGYDCIVETAFPNLVRIGNGVNIGMRTTIIGHFRGMENCASRGPTVVIGDSAFIGPGVIVLPNVSIGECAVVAAGSVVSADIPPYFFAQGNPARVLARCGVALAGDVSYEEFLAKLVPLTLVRREVDGGLG